MHKIYKKCYELLFENIGVTHGYIDVGDGKKSLVLDWFPFFATKLLVINYGLLTLIVFFSRMSHVSFSDKLFDNLKSVDSLSQVQSKWFLLLVAHS